MVTVIKDEQLMLRVAEGNLDAFNELVRRHQRTAWRIAHRFLGDPAEAEDVAQEAFLRILAAAPRYKPSAAFSTYLYRVVARLCIDNTRKKRPVFTNTLPETVDSSPDPATALVQKDRDALIRKALDALPSRQRMVVILKYYEGLRYGEIARAMGTTVKAVERLLGRARKTLQSSLSRIRK
ncbi:MAG: sigma-70 family RNA polymerase sigma factor [Deltaproteobacteria bacterium]|nr:sigma-70 family RNA polymerase sigma factor [Deltaproteobacteria bacterium]